MTTPTEILPVDTTNTDPGYPRAPWGKRILAFVIDSLVAGLLTTVLFAFMIYVMWMYLTYQQPKFLEGASEAVFYIYVFVTAFSFVWLAVYSLARDGVYRGQSLGKLMCGLMVINVEKNQPCNLIGSLLRNVPGFATVLISFVLIYCAFIFVLIEPVAVFSNEKGLRLGDRWAKTQVIEKKHYREGKS